MRLRWRIPLAFVLATALLAGIVALVAAVALRGVLLDRLQDDMSRQAWQYAATLETVQAESVAGDQADPVSAATLQTLTESVGDTTDTRFTVIDRSGQVLADSEADPDVLENHADRPEVRQALAGNESRARRYSTTLGQDLVYVAVPLASSDAAWSEGVVRLAQPASRIDATLAASWRIPLIVWAVLLAPTVIAAYLLSRSISRPVQRLVDMTTHVAEGDLAARNAVHRRDELGQLAEALNDMAAQLERRASELDRELERSRGVLRAMSEAVVLVDSEGRLIRSNPAAAAVLDASLEGREGEPLVHLARAFPALRLAEATHETGRPLTEVVELPDGRSLAVETVPLQPDYRGEGHTLFVVRDETQRRNTEAVRRDFVANASHELKTPLASLSLLVDTLSVALHEDPKKAAECVEKLRFETQRLANLTNDLLTLSQLEEEPVASSSGPAPVDLARLAHETAAEMEPLAAARQQDLQVQTPEELLIPGDSADLETLIRNLLDNAIRYTQEAGHISLSIHTAEDKTGEPLVQLSVQDDGEGIPAADQERIFERFYRVDKARSRETGGTGLGLSIVKHVAESHGGWVTVDSTLGVGSNFTVSLPR